MKMAKNRLTRNSFKRKIIVFGVAIFMSVAMMATGFAAWVISSNAKVDGQIGVEVTTIKDAAIEIVLDGELFPSMDGEVYTHKSNFAFGTDSADIKGKVKSSAEDELKENLSITILGTVKGIEQLGKLTLEINFGDILESVEALGYIALPETEICFFDITNPEAKTEGTTFNKDELKDEATFSYTITIGWGKNFAYVNPGYYYDGVKNANNDDLDPAALAESKYKTKEAIEVLTVAQIMQDIKDFRAAFGFDPEQDKDLTIVKKDTDDKIVKVIVKAEVK